MANNKSSQDKWVAVVIWFGLLVAALYTSNSIVGVFGEIVNYLFNIVGGTGESVFKALSSNYGALFLILLVLALIFLIFNAWRNLVTLTFELVFAFSGELDEPLFKGLLDFEETGEEGSGEAIRSLPSVVLRDLAISWALFYLIFFVLPIVTSF
jgi:hypothetical protein